MLSTQEPLRNKRGKQNLISPEGEANAKTCFKALSQEIMHKNQRKKRHGEDPTESPFWILKLGIPRSLPKSSTQALLVHDNKVV
ncbi:hypothetical protein BGAL_0141g00210 [Botrytis galanthina]|uniref:Uncharacterized protein n=1 Tax=Botrytis galanthina TaxID=278940 RepID=A0A4S8R019_9HELO|nr:hypothetical protein BGAL_0141g00210 [Botrytis galanthina]